MSGVVRSAMARRAGQTAGAGQTKGSGRLAAMVMVMMMALVGAAGAMVGCGERGEAVGDEPAVVHTYQVRGQITQLPGDAPGQELRIHHEPIDEFRNAAGEIDPMAEMTMPFPPAPGVSLAGFEVGDKVLATLEVQWEPEAGWTMTEIEKLPEGTELNIGQARRDHDSHDHNHDHDHHDHEH